METSRIAELLHSFLMTSTSDKSSTDKSPLKKFLPSCHSKEPDDEESVVLSETQLQQISAYIDILLRWNTRINLTAVCEPEEIVARHFGESLFAARVLFPMPDHQANAAHSFVDIGSGPGFPGLPIKIWAPVIHATLIESNQKKATFLREVCRSITLTNIDVFSNRAEEFPVGKAQTVTLRAVERFETVLPTAIRLLAPSGRLALLIGEAQIKTADRIAPHIDWGPHIAIPQSDKRVVLIGTVGAHLKL